ncbi:D-alanyl-D-alanine carboxypeptidase family protein [Mediterraneibacter gnavus]|uniref:serine-type D-Ala-D-Ala carboxypeptidase n=1 Tax=Mediterraneibacter gnavus TaxID=33038 RepID=A0AAW6K5N4_MEDGN|nr:D-alanyl-D-alanine carboxypeptidase family protein [Mediterraneibacter gnavus]MDC6140238.1 D-alanyl-D-alanine carboxypeptidase [Mediterraneibacter gnavus]MDE1203804.1 D-alanyl-D-alanine carboxypeptidase [Mediterraneibacter gnavus]RHM38187.1 D-alanyl-D-alanine carboxypeptidase [Mediterraneibacter gnavus]
MKRVLAVLLSAVLSLSVAVVPGIQTLAEEPDAAQKTEGQQEAEVEVQAPSAVLMEASTGAVLYEKDADTRRAPASVTKIMTMLLIFDALEDGKIALEDEVSTSEYAASMGGSQVFLEPGETQSVDTMLKCISVASANDACTAMAEYIAGSEEAFVKMMNERAAGLGMKNTTFQNCNGLDTEGHLTTARDIALMSRELIEKYPKIHDYCMIWMDTITHTTKKGTSEFGLSNTNKLVRQYPYATGLKTGSTDEAKFCVSATAEKDGMELIAVILGGENSKQRFQDATKLLNYGFGKCQVYEDNDPPKLKPAEVQGGVKEQILCEYADTFRYLDTSGANLAGVTKKTQMKQSVKAPVKKGQKVGELVYKLGEKEIGRVEILAKESCKKAEFLDYLKKVMQKIRV